ncbi:MAG: histidine kinase [Lachnospiraceae bacterium]|nr:histidine kinase [Lachnospiraceae bacterium]
MKRTAKGILQNLFRYKYNSILIRNFCLTMVMVMAPLLVVIVIVRINLDTIVQKEISEANRGSLVVVAETLDMVIDKMFSFSYYLTENAEFGKLQVYGLEEVFDEYSEILEEQIYFNMLIEEYIDSVYIYMQDEEIVLSADRKQRIINKYTLSEMGDMTWKLGYDHLNVDKSYMLYPRLKRNFYPYLMTMIRPMSNIEKNRNGAVIVNVDMKKLSEYLGLKSRNGLRFYMMGQDGKLIYSNQVTLFENGAVMPEYLDILWTEEADGKIREIDGENYVVSVVDSENYDCRYVLCTPYADSENRLNEVSYFIGHIIVITFLLGLVVTYVMTVYSFSPIQRIINELDKGKQEEEQGDESFLFDENGAGNELQYIIGMVRQARLHNNKLISETENWVKKLNDAQMIALQSQINPHYLYNTLDMINWDAARQLGSGNSVSQMITTLAQFLRIGLSRGSYLVGIAEEMEHAKLYTRIIEARYEGTIRVKWDIDEEILLYKIVRLTLQPLIENAINHGLKPKRYQGNIVIRGGVVEDFLYLVVEDDGIGMSNEQCVVLNHELMENYEDKNEHIGIRNVNQRIKILFGEEYGISLRAKAEGGLIVRVITPKLK